MRLDYLKIEKFKNLEDFEIDFDEACTEPVTVVLGRNGSGKSNLFEALVIIFRDLMEGRSTSDFGYELRYTLKGGSEKVSVQNPASVGRRLLESRDGTVISDFAFSVTKDGGTNRIARKDIPNHLPRYVVTYYSGVSNRMEHHFYVPQREFRDQLLKGNKIPLRPLFYAKPIHSHFALLAFFMTDDVEIKEFLSDYPWIEEFESALFVLKRPHWARGKSRRKGGDPRFWNAGGVVKDFLGCLYDCALAPVRIPGRIQHSFDQIENTEFLYLFLRDTTKLQELAKKSLSAMSQKSGSGKEGGEASAAAVAAKFSAAEFFKLLESTFMSDLIHETRIRVKVRNAGALTFRELSEGEQQLLTVVGMLRFTRDDDSLFLLDEPDTHLNPAWGMEYLNILNKHAHTGRNSHLLVATHDPLVLTNLRRNQIAILERDEESGKVSAFEPSEDPLGMGVQGILRNMFGIRSAVGTEVQKMLDERASLLALGDERTAAQQDALKTLTEELSALGFGREFRDPDYAQFIRAVARRPEFTKPVLTVEEQQKQEIIADEILDDILGGSKKT